jgi:hypothetical protein
MTPDSRNRLLALLAVVALFGLVWLYVREFAVLYNTIAVGRLVAGSLLVAAMAISAVLWRWRERFSPWERHLPEVISLIVFGLLFAPFLGSLLNRSIGSDTHQSFEFVSEVPFLASNYGVLKGEQPRPSGYYLTVKDGGRYLEFKYKTQAYYPLTKPGEMILLPVRNGIFGFRVMTLR